MTITLILLGFLAFVVYFKHRAAETKRAHFLAKYQDQQLVDRLIYEDVFKGETAEQLRDSLGTPTDMVEQECPGKTRRTWRYKNDRRHRYQRQVTLENDVVVGWNQQ